MKLFVKAKPSSKKEFVEKIDENHFIDSVKAPAKEGRANRAVVKALARYLNIAPSNMELVSGLSSKNKIFEI